MIEKADPSQSGKFIYYCSLNCYNQANSPAQTTGSGGAPISAAGGGLPVIQSVASLAPAASGPPPVTQLPPMPPSQPMAPAPPQVVCLTFTSPQFKNGLPLNMAIRGIKSFSYKFQSSIYAKESIKY